MKADKRDIEKSETALSGKVVLKTFGEGSKSEHEAIYLETANGSYVLRRQGGNPFNDPVLFKLEGKNITARGILNKYVFLAKEIKESDPASDGL
jgi:hypothetical protein